MNRNSINVVVIRNRETYTIVQREVYLNTDKGLGEGSRLLSTLFGDGYIIRRGSVCIT